MKKFLFFAVALIATIGMSACSDGSTGPDSNGGGNDIPKPNIQFATSTYALDDKAIEVKIAASAAPKANLTVDFTLGGTATAEDYELSAEAFILKAGETEAVVTITPKQAYPTTKTLTLALRQSSSYDVGRVGSTTVTMKSTIHIYSFTAASADMQEGLDITLTINESTYKAPTAIEIPFKALAGSTAELGKQYLVKDEVTSFVVPQGGNTAKITLFAGPETDNANPTTLKLGIDEEATGGRFTAGQNADITITVKGGLSFGVLEGKWVHKELLGLDELLAAEEGIETEPLPINNENYFFEIKEVDGVWSFVQGDVAGDLSKLFRTSTIKYTAPFNNNEGTIVGNYTTVGEFYTYTYQDDCDLTYFELDPANRSFDNTNEKIGKTTIALQLLDDGSLVLFLRDYDKPPFCDFWWEEGLTGADFSFFFGFGYIFEKATK